jgi:L-2-hydroxyglutarate oxidase LhgO
VEGKQRLYEYCETHHVPYRRCGKLIVATTSNQVPGLEKLLRRAERNGVRDLRLLTAAQVLELEPQLQVEGALLSPSTGIVDSHALMLALLGDAQSHGAALALQSPLLRARHESDGFLLEIGDADSTKLHAPVVVNAAGLHAIKVAASIEGMNTALLPSMQLSKGQYSVLLGKGPFSRLIYPVGDAAHAPFPYTFDLGGQVRVGPSVERVDWIDYNLKTDDLSTFYDGARDYWPALKEGSLNPGFCGNWAKLANVDGQPADFVIQTSATHGIPGLVNLFGIDSPGLTSCLAIAEEVCSGLNLDCNGLRVPVKRHQEH